MASTSSSSLEKSFKYDVFLSFRGEDTRKTFVDHLYLALDNKGIETYKDDQKIEKGERIDDQLIRSIEESRFYIIVFSKKYADSSWCLQELSKIMECQKTKEHTAYPIFYDVEPTEVRNQSGAVGDAFAKHVQNPAAGKWRDALKEASGLVGWELKNTFDGHEAKFIQNIVTKISIKLHLINWNINEMLVGMETRVKNVISSLGIDSEDDVRMIGIWGMGGAGKTTFAEAIFNHISIWFEGKSFVENVREVSKGSLSGLKELQKQVLKDVLNDQSIDVTSVYDGKNKMKKMMPCRKVLVVLDDVDNKGQLEELAGELTWFKPGSRIIITTRDKQVLIAHGVHVDNIYNISLLSREEAICLFSKHAFRRNVPIQGYEEKLSLEVVKYSAGLPLTIKVLGSFLCGRTEPMWLDTLERLKTIPSEEALKKLEISYDGLERDQKEMFLDVACILKGKLKYKAIKMLESCGFNAQIGLEVLEQKSLIYISDHGNLRMHDHIEEMGKNIVRRLHPDEPNRHSRLWVKEEIEEILDKNLGTKATRSMILNDPDIDRAKLMRGLRKMKKLRLLYVYDDDLLSGKWKIDDGVQYLPDTLRSLYWFAYPFCCLPKTFQANNLVNIEMTGSYISQLWDGGERKVLEKIRFVDLSFSKLRTFDLGTTRNLETLDLRNCKDMAELQMPSELPKLNDLILSHSKVSNLNLKMTPNIVNLDLKGCKDLVELQLPNTLSMLSTLDLSDSKVSNVNLEKTPKIKNLYLRECKNLILQIPVELLMLKTLHLSDSKASNLNLRMTPNIESLSLASCKDFTELQVPVALPMLNHLDLSHSNVISFNLEMTPNIKDMYLQSCICLEELQMPVALSMLKTLWLDYSKVSNLNLEMTPNIEKLSLKGCKDLVKLQMPVALPMLEYLHLSDSKVSNLNLEMTPNIKFLCLEQCKDLVELEMPVALPMLYFLELSDSNVRDLNLELTPDLTTLNLIDCYYLQEIRAPVGCLKKLTRLKLSGCLRFEYVRVNTQHFSPRVDSFAKLELIAESLGRCPLHPNSNLPKFKFKCKYGEVLPSSSGNLEKLLSFGLCACTNLESFSSSICGLQNLIALKLEGSIPEVPKDLWKLESLERLTLSMKEIKHLPDNICMLKRLKYLDLTSCEHLEQLPMDLGGLECLEELHLTDCESLRDIPDNICQMKRLKNLDLCRCIQVEKLPEELGRLECLEELDLVGAGISRLPESIFELKDLRIRGSTLQLESYGFTSVTEATTNRAFCYIRDHFDLNL